MKIILLTLSVLISVSFTAHGITWTVGNSGLNFSPATITISLGDEVDFVIGGSHNALEVSMATWDANGNTPLPGFETPFGGGLVTAAELGLGTHYYVCSPHASAGMKGRIIVENCTIPDMPAPIMGETIACEGGSYTYSINPVNGATSYIWTLPAGWSGSSSTESISTVAGFSGGDITVKAENDCGESSEQILTVTVDHVPDVPDMIDGENDICAFSNNIYSISPVNGATSYTWFLPSGWSGNSSTETITTNAGSQGGDIRVVANNDCGASDEQLLSVIVNSAPNRPQSISGNNIVCSSSQNTYSVTPVNGATSYTWTLPSGWTGMSNSESILATAGMDGGDITVTANNDCGSSSTQFVAVTVNNIPNMPGTISGDGNICEATSTTYSITPVMGATSYTWTLPSGWTGMSNSESILATAGMDGGDITVTADNDCGSSSTQLKAVTVSNIPNMPGAISGDSSICEATSTTYSITPVMGATSYTWTLPNGWTGMSNSESIMVTAGMNGGDISVTANNDCGNSSNQIMAVNVDTLNINVEQSGSTLNAELDEAEYQWIDCSDNEPLDGETNQSFTASSNGDYAVILTKNNCTDTSECYNIMTTSNDNYLFSNMVLISPNPTYGKFNLVLKNGSNLKFTLVQIFNSDGKIIFVESNGDSEIDLSERPKGIYYIKIWNKNMVTVKKLILQ